MGNVKITIMEWVVIKRGRYENVGDMVGVTVGFTALLINIRNTLTILFDRKNSMFTSLIENTYG